MTDVPIVSEVRKGRREILEAYGWDYRRMLQGAMGRQKESGRKVVRLEKRKPRQGVALKLYGAGSKR